MGKLVEQTLPTMFQGVSRQPETVRSPGQVQNAKNAVFSVVTGGFEKRAGTFHIAELTGVPSSGSLFTYMYDRDENEQYVIIIENGDISVFDLDGNAKTITFPDGKAYLAASDPENEFAAVTIADYTLIVNKTVATALTGAGTGTVYGPVKSYSDLPRSGETVPSYLSALDTGSSAGTWDSSDTGCANGSIWKVEGEQGDRLGHYFVKLDNTGSVWEWSESVDPNFDNDFDPATMPHQLVRNANGTFTFQQATWDSREVGDPDIVPDPDFVGKMIADIAFHRDRLVIVADEFVYFSQAGDYFNMWPDKATQVLDSDPFGRVAWTSQVSVLRFAAPFRKALFATADSTQFEVSANGELFAERYVSMDPATTFKASEQARPVTMGNSLYFAAESNKDAVVFEYFYEQDSLGTDAGEINKHALGYIPAPLIRFAGDTVSSTLLCLSNAERNALYSYVFYWDDDEKVQNAWGKWTLGDDTTAANILGMDFVNGYLYVVVRRGASTFLERVLPSDEFNDEDSAYLVSSTDSEGETTRWPVRLDRRQSLTGTYDAGTDKTTWTIDYAHGDALVGILSDDFGAGARGRQLSLSYPTTTTVTATGDFSSGAVIFGKSYTMEVELSRQYLHEGRTNRSITTGRLQLRHIYFDYQNTGYFEVHITPKARDTKTYKFTGRIIGDEANIVGNTPIIRSGTYRAKVNSDASTVQIKVVNDTHVPSTITSAKWTGFFNEITRQE